MIHNLNERPSQKPVGLLVYEGFIDVTVDKFDKLNNRFTKIDIIDLRFVGLLILIVGIFGKFMSASTASERQIFTPVEFITIASIGTLLLILGLYFSVKKMQENRKAVDDASKTFAGKLQSGEWVSQSISQSRANTSNPASST